MLLPLLLLANAVEDTHVPYTLTAVGHACDNNFKVVSSEAKAAPECADLVCADAQCGTLFEFSDGTGQCSCLEAGLVCIERVEAGTNRFEITDTSTCEPKSTDNCFATLYSEGYFGGWAASFTTGSFTTEDIENAGGADDEVSSVFVSGEGCTATLYANADFTGWAVRLEEGSYSLDELESRGFTDDDTSAVKIGHISAVGAEPVGSGKGQTQGGKKKKQVSTSYRPSKPRKPTTTPEPFHLDCNPLTKQNCTKEEVDFIVMIEKRRVPHGAERLEEEKMHLKLHRNFEFPEKRRWVDNRVAILQAMEDDMREREAKEAEEAAAGKAEREAMRDGL